MFPNPRCSCPSSSSTLWAEWDVFPHPLPFCWHSKEGSFLGTSSASGPTHRCGSCGGRTDSCFPFSSPSPFLCHTPSCLPSFPRGSFPSCTQSPCPFLYGRSTFPMMPASGKPRGVRWHTHIPSSKSSGSVAPPLCCPILEFWGAIGDLLVLVPDVHRNRTC